MAASLHSEIDVSSASLSNSQGNFDALLVCEHASNFIPEQFGKLGLAPELLASHIAWDPGAGEVAHILSHLMNAPLVKGEISRLLYDCNRPPDAADAMPGKSELYDIPGNLMLSEQEKAYRIEFIYNPFRQCIESVIERAKSLITVHSFNPVYRGVERSVQIGILHDTDPDFADLILEAAPKFSDLEFRRNEPYGPGDGVMHTLQLHGIANGIPNVMIEIRNDLIATKADCEKIARLLHELINHALIRLCEVGRIEEVRQ